MNSTLLIDIVIKYYDIKLFFLIKMCGSRNETRTNEYNSSRNI